MGQSWDAPGSRGRRESRLDRLALCGASSVQSVAVTGRYLLPRKISWNARKVIAEKNQGGDMIESVLRGVDSSLPVRLVIKRERTPRVRAL